MAVPTLTACAPTVIFTGGQLVTLTGSNFRLPYPLPNVNGPIPVPPPTVAVTVNGTSAEQVRVFSATSLTCLVGASDPGAASITVQNLDVNGNPIGGEVVTVASGLAVFARADLTKEADFTRATKALMTLLKQQTIENVVKTVETDYSSTPGASVFDIPEIASLPCIVVSGPKTKWNPLYEYDKTPEQSVGSTGFNRRRMIKTVDLTYTVQGFDDHDGRASNLQVLMEQVMVINQWLVLQRDPTDPTQGTVEYELEGGDWQNTNAPNMSNVRSFTCEITVKGFQLEYIIGFPNQMVVETGEQVDTITTLEENLPTLTS